MNSKIVFALLVAATLSAVVVAVAEDSDAEVVDNGTWYCYGDNPVIQPIYEGDFDWDVTRSDGQSVSYTENGDGSLTVNIADVPNGVTVRVEQSNGTDTAHVTLIPIHLPQDEDEKSDDGVYTVTFHDGDNIPYTRTFTTSTTVQQGSQFLFPPTIEREGYVFGGWYTHPNCEDEYILDCGDVVSSDMEVYAKWTGTGTGGGSHTIVVRDTSVVTFEPVYGLRYDVVSLGGSTLSFTVIPVDGVLVDSESIEVSADGGRLTFDRGVYTLSGINRDILVTAVCDTMFTVEYRLDGVTLSMEGYEELPTNTLGGSFDAVISAMDGFESPEVSVFMDGRDITDSSVVDGRIHIEDVSGNLVITGHADESSGFSWWVIVLIIIVVAVIVAALYLKSRNQSV